MGETLRFEIVSDSKEEFNSWRRKVEDKIEQIRKASSDSRYCLPRHSIVATPLLFITVASRNHILP